MKKCYKCFREKDESEFYKDKSRSDGLQAWCKLCKKTWDKAHHAEYMRRCRVTKAYKKALGG